MHKVRERKKTGVHGTPLTWKFNSKQLLSKTLNSRMNMIETRAVLNIVKTVGKCDSEAEREGLPWEVDGPTMAILIAFICHISRK